MSSLYILIVFIDLMGLPTGLLIEWGSSKFYWPNMGSQSIIDLMLLPKGQLEFLKQKHDNDI